MDVEIIKKNLSRTMDPHIFLDHFTWFSLTSSVIRQIQCINAQAEMYGAHSSSYICVYISNTFIHIYMYTEGIDIY